MNIPKKETKLTLGIAALVVVSSILVLFLMPCSGSESIFFVMSCINVFLWFVILVIRVFKFKSNERKDD